MPTLSDVARHAGVSTATVSRVLSGARARVPISDATRARVWAAVEALGYRPNLTARSLSRRRTQTVGLVLPRGSGSVDQAYNARILAGIADTLTAHGYSLALYFSDYGRLRQGPNHAVLVQDGRVDGALVVDSYALDDWQVAELEESSREFPLVLIGHRLPRSHLHFVAADDRGGAASVTEHLLSLGHRRIVHIRNPHGHPTRERFLGYQAALARHGLPLDPQWVVDDQAGLAALLRGTQRPTAVFAWNDFTAMAALRTAHDAGLAVPGHVSVVGYDDFEVASLTLPALTTVREPLYELGAQGAAIVLQLLGRSRAPAASCADPARDGPGGDQPSGQPARVPARVPAWMPVQRVLPAALVVRESTAAPPPASTGLLSGPSSL